MKYIFSIVTTLIIMTAVRGQNYVGTLTTNSYSQKEAHMVVTISGERATLEMCKVKFAKLMPVKVDVKVKELECRKEGGISRLRGDGIIPLSGGKPHANRTIHGFKGTATANKLTFECKMGDKHVTFSGHVMNGK